MLRHVFYYCYRCQEHDFYGTAFTIATDRYYSVPSTTTTGVRKMTTGNVPAVPVVIFLAAVAVREAVP